MYTDAVTALRAVARNALVESVAIMRHHAWRHGPAVDRFVGGAVWLLQIVGGGAPVEIFAPHDPHAALFLVRAKWGEALIALTRLGQLGVHRGVDPDGLGQALRSADEGIAQFHRAIDADARVNVLRGGAA